MSKLQDSINQFEISKKNFLTVRSFLERKEYSTLYSALLNLVSEAERENNRLLQSINDLTLASLAIRNLFELFLISKHIYSDEKGLLNWYGQSHKDSKEVRTGFITLMKQKGLDTTELESIQKFEDDSLAQSPFQSKGSFQIRTLAEKYNYLNDYNFLYKLSSKLVHPSSMKIMSYETLVENQNYLSVVLQVGVFFTQEFSLFLQDVVNEAA